MYALVGVSVLFAALNNILLHFLAKRKYNPFLFNAMISLVWVVGLALFNLGWKGCSSQTVLYGFLYGLTLTCFIFFKTIAMSSGPIALTALIGCSAFIVTTVFNGIYWKEKVGVFEITGIVLMLVSVLAINYVPTNKGEARQKLSWKWKIYCALFFIFSAATGIFFRLHQEADKVHTDEMMILAAAFSCFVLIAIYFVARFTGKKDKTVRVAETGNETAARKLTWTVIVLALACGVCSCVYNRLNIYLTGVLPTTTFSPIFNGGVVIASFFSGSFFFREKPTRLQCIGVGLGFLALLAFSRFFGLF